MAINFLFQNEEKAENYINPGDYMTEEQYRAALIAKQKELDSPEYKAAALHADEVIEEQRAAKEAAALKEKQQSYINSASLSDVEREQLFKEALELAQRDVHAGRISQTGIAKAQQKYFEQLQSKARTDKAENMLFNDVIRSIYRGYSAE